MRSPLLLTLPLAATLILGACATSGSAGPTPSLREAVTSERSSAGCVVPPDLVGQSHTALQTMAIKTPVRVIFPGTKAPSDKNASRLLITVDRKGIITKASCG